MVSSVTSVMGPSNLTPSLQGGSGEGGSRLSLKGSHPLEARKEQGAS